MKTLRSLLPAALVLSWTGCTTVVTPSPKEQAQLAVLASSADLHEKARACQELAVFAGPASVPALAALLDQENLADYARSGLEGIKDSSAGDALRQALGKLSGRQLAGVVNSLGVRRETAAVPDLQQLILDPKQGAVAEALAALGLIGSAEAARILQTFLTHGPADLRVPAAHAALTAAAQLAKEDNVAAARGLLDAVGRALPDGNLATVAKNQVAAFDASRGPAARK